MPSNVSAPPFYGQLVFESKTIPTGFTLGYYIKNDEGYSDAMDDLVSLLNALLPMLPPDCHCLKASVRNNNPDVKKDSWDRYFLTGEKSGSYAPSVGEDIAPMPYDVAMKVVCQDLSTGQWANHHVRPLPRTLVLDGKNLTPDAAYTTAMNGYEAELKAKVQLEVQGLGSTPSAANVDEVIFDLEVVEKDTGLPYNQRRGRARTHTTL